MIRITRVKFGGFLLTLIILSLFNLTMLGSCVKDTDELYSQSDGNKPGEEEDETPKEGDGSDGSEDEFILPEGYTFPLSYVSLPEGTPQQIKEYTGFTVNFNKDNKTPNYVCWELTKEESSGDVDRNDYSYWQDLDLEGCPTTDYAYSTSHYQRGHMCPAADQKWSTQAMADCMVMSNMCPQAGDINEKAWATLESKERTWAKRDGAIWIIAGPIYNEEDQQRIGFSQVRVPSAFFKVFLYNNGENSRSIAFVYPNALAPGNMSEYSMSIDALEEALGYDFFPSLPDELEERIESECDFNTWNK